MKAFIIILTLFNFLPSAHAQRDIFAAARTGDTTLAKTLITQDPTLVNALNEQEYTPVILAAYYGHTGFIKVLIQHDLLIEEKPGSATALQAAAYKGYTDVVALLLEFGAIPDIADANGTTPLIYAAEAGHLEIVKLLLNYGADKNYKDPQGLTALAYAEKFQQNEIAELLKK